MYEKQQKLRIMMKMHGLGDGPYWMISYSYFLTLSILYVMCLVISGSWIGMYTGAIVLARLALICLTCLNIMK